MLKRTVHFSLLTALTTFGLSVAAPATAQAQEEEEAVRHGVELRGRFVFLPEGIIETFVEDAASGMSNPGFGLAYVRRKGDFELSVGLSRDSLSPSDGYYVERGEMAANPGSTDFLEFDGLAWYTFDVNFVFHKPLTKMVALRYGGGLGWGMVTGDIFSTDAGCTGNDAQNDCQPLPGAPRVKEEFFRYPPALAGLVGAQITPVKNLAINLEVGIRTVFYTGMGVQYFF